MDREPKDSTAEVTTRGLYAAYATGFFSLSLVPMTHVVVPLWALALGASPALIGITVAARSLLPLLFSIHGGVMMDRLGTRRMTLFFTLIGAVFALLYPLLPWVSTLIVLQLLVGLTQGMSWIGAQTKIAKLTRVSSVYAGRFSFITTLGTFVGPLLVGKAWDVFGAWGAFVVIGVWGGCLSCSVFALPAPDQPDGRSQQRLAWRDFLPNWTDYVRAFALVSIPAVALVIMATFLRIAAFSVQGSFYTVYLEGIGFSGTMIGALFAVSSLLGSLATLLVGPVTKVIQAHWALLVFITTAIVVICITPLLEDFVFLLIAAGIFGIGLGMGLPLLLSILSKAIRLRDQGMSVGLRTTANRLASLFIPLMMGFAIEMLGIKMGFLVVALVLLAIVGITIAIVLRTPTFSAESNS